MFKTAFDVFQNEKSKTLKIRTYVKKLDEVCDIMSGIITEFCGGPGVGKTMMCLQLCINAQLAEIDLIYNRNGKAIFIDSNQGFNPFVLKDIAEYTSQKLLKGLKIQVDVEDFLSNIEYVYCLTIPELKKAIETIKTHLENGQNIKLIAIDSFAYIFRNFNGTSQQRTRIIFEILTNLQILADKFEFAVVITNEFTTKITETNETTLYPALGEAYAHKISQRLIFERGVLHRRIFLYKTSSASFFIPFMINSTGLRSVNLENI